MIGPEQLQHLVRKLPDTRDKVRGYRDMNFEVLNPFAPRGFRNPNFFDERAYSERIRFTFHEDYLNGVLVGYWAYHGLMVKMFPL